MNIREISDEIQDVYGAFQALSLSQENEPQLSELVCRIQDIANEKLIRKTPEIIAIRDCEFATGPDTLDGFISDMNSFSALLEKLAKRYV